MQAEYITSRASILLHDSTAVRWPAIQLVDYVNDGQREIVLNRPDASVSNTVMLLASGNTKQSLPSGGIRLMSVIRNMGADGATAGAPVMVVDRDILDTQLPGWHSAETEDAAQHYVFDPKDPTTFYIYPRPSATVYIELAFSTPPTDCITVGSTLGISPIYANALLDYVLYRALSKDSAYADQPRAQAAYGSFLQSLGLKTQADIAIDPNND